MKEAEIDTQDELALRLRARKWMSGEKGPGQDWRCARESCVFFKGHCAHGLNTQVKAQ